MRERALNRLAEAIRGSSHRVVREHHPLPQRAVVRSIDPLGVELHEGSLLLEDEDLTVTQHIRQYDRDYGIVVGDTVLVIPVSGGEFVVTAVIGQKDTFEGIQTQRLAGSDLTNPDIIYPPQTVPPGISLGIIGWQAVHDAGGNIIGYSRIWGRTAF